MVIFGEGLRVRENVQRGENGKEGQGGDAPHWPIRASAVDEFTEFAQSERQQQKDGVKVRGHGD